MWFNGNFQKIVSVSASVATSSFNLALFNNYLSELSEKVMDLKNNPYNDAELLAFSFNFNKEANFDSRVWQINPDLLSKQDIDARYEVFNYFLWRQQDTVRNSISAVAQSLFSHKELLNKNADEMKEMSLSLGENGIDWDGLSNEYKYGRMIVKNQVEVNGTIRNKWQAVPAPLLEDNKDFLFNLIPDTLNDEQV